jgi:DNA-binding response OmpR family regulator
LAASVLVVEDDDTTRRLYREALTAAGYQAIAAEDGIAALLYLDSHPAPDAVVLNLLLPRISGHVVYEELRSRKATRATPMVIVTGDELRRFDEDEYVTMLRKPLDASAVVAAVAAALGRTPSPPVG